jgi:hypothetical protein
MPPLECGKVSKCRVDTEDDDLTGLIDERDAKGTFLDKESDGDVSVGMLEMMTLTQRSAS